MLSIRRLRRNDYSVRDEGRLVGRIYREVLLGEVKWRWSLDTSPLHASLPHNGVAGSLEEAKAAFKRRYEEVKGAHYPP